LTIQLSIEPHLENRVVRVMAESPELYRRSDITLDGDCAPRTKVIGAGGR
jgi:hypothetical protein